MQSHEAMTIRERSGIGHLLKTMAPASEAQHDREPSGPATSRRSAADVDVDLAVRVLVVLLKAPHEPMKPRQINDIAAELNEQPSAVMRVVEFLEQSGHVAMGTDEDQTVRFIFDKPR